MEWVWSKKHRNSSGRITSQRSSHKNELKGGTLFTDKSSETRSGDRNRQLNKRVPGQRQARRNPSLIRMMAMAAAVSMLRG